jgi:hypothetical protein
MRQLGTRIYKDAQMSYVRSASEKLWIEAYFEMWLAICINFMGFHVYHLMFSEFFKGSGNIINIILLVICTLLLIALLIYSLY